MINVIESKSISPFGIKRPAWMNTRNTSPSIKNEILWPISILVNADLGLNWGNKNDLRQESEETSFCLEPLDEERVSFQKFKNTVLPPAMRTTQENKSVVHYIIHQQIQKFPMK